jgi:hypothetical protein
MVAKIVCACAGKAKVAANKAKAIEGARDIISISSFYLPATKERKLADP